MPTNSLCLLPPLLCLSHSSDKTYHLRDNDTQIPFNSSLSLSCMQHTTFPDDDERKNQRRTLFPFSLTSVFFSSIPVLISSSPAEVSPPTMALDPYAPPYFPSSYDNIYLNQNSAQTNIYHACSTHLLPQPQYYITLQYPHVSTYQQYHFPPHPVGENIMTNMQVQEVESKWSGGGGGGGGGGSSSSSARERASSDFPRRMVRRSKYGRVGKRNRRFLPLPFPPSDVDYQIKEQDEGGCRKTTVMIRNIPNKIIKKELLEILDVHCCRENQRLQAAGNSSSWSEFDFLYLPMDFRSGSNLGYGFVNFTSPEAARRLHRDLHNKRWNMFGSRKVCEITYARVQGLASLKAHFNNSVFNCESDEYLPVVFQPCRNGFDLPDQYYYVGKRL